MGKKNLVLILCSVFLFDTLNAQMNIKTIIKKVRPTTVLVKAYKLKGVSIGSGFFISQNRIVSNRHVFEGAFDAIARLTNGEECKVLKVVAESKQHDLICVEIEKPKTSIIPLILEPKLPEVGDHVVVVGNPEGFEATVSEGIVSAIREIEIPFYGGVVIQITAPISPGSSGGPVVNMEGEVIGVASMTFVGGQNLNFVIPSENILLLDYDVEKPLPLFFLSELEDSLKKKSMVQSIFEIGQKLVASSPEVALEYFMKLEQICEDPIYTALAIGEVAFCYFSLQQYTKVESVAINNIPKLDKLSNLYGYDYNTRGTIVDMKKLLYFLSGHSCYFLALQEHDINRKKERLINAKEALIKAIEVSRDSDLLPSTHYLLGQIYLELGERDLAFNEYQILLSLGDKEHADTLFNKIYEWENR